MIWKHWRGRSGSETWAASATNGLTIEVERCAGGRDLRGWSWSLTDLRRVTHGVLYGGGSFFHTAADARAAAVAALRRLKPARPRPLTFEALFGDRRPRPWRSSRSRKRFPKPRPDGWILSDL